ncbi:HIT family protein [Actibacterium sp. 188UL27-1]|uniref:HIT family protein n=1 Tax=Actibacterium sp. 188UL27-1 TaxID=2786961 RepID=UPI0019564EBF|nr:HIT family protein [Actibacterium sp. 188UL27-1]MBM7066670.1 HIT family protein [Actibacterium sp. 188UL27-1]
MDCIFCDIVAGRTAASVAYRDDRLMVFADHRPIRPGHVQIIPREHYAVFEDVPPELLAEIAVLGQRIARLQKRLYTVARVGFAFTGHDVAHCHAHVIPLHAASDVTSARYADGSAALFITRAQMDATARHIELGLAQAM